MFIFLEIINETCYPTNQLGEIKRREKQNQQNVIRTKESFEQTENCKLYTNSF